MAIPLIGFFAKWAIGSYIAPIITFVKTYFKEILIALALGAIFYGGIMYERIKKDKEIAILVEHYKKEQKDREDGIDKKIAEIEKSAREAAVKLQGQKDTAEANVRKLQQDYIVAIAKRETRIAQLKEQLKNTTLPPKEKEELEKELAGLKLTYKLSPIATVLINNMVKEYAK